MRFISYSQNNEDVLLWRALGHVRDGFYIDVGANDPVEHSVTKAFYDAGWRGINIEPLPAHIAAFDEQRPGDVNLAVAAGSAAGSLTLYDVPDVRGWASPEKSVADLHRAEGHTVAELTVPVRTLADVCEEFVRGEIHFLKVDVEGFEGEVLRGMDFERWRPWVLVIEATLPNSRETNHASWEHLVTNRRYRYAWFDGLNRYYVAEEHAELMASFGIQPNVFDDYISYHLDRAWSANKAATQALRDTEEQADAARAELHDMMQFAENLETEKQEALAAPDRDLQQHVVEGDAAAAHGGRARHPPAPARPRAPRAHARDEEPAHPPHPDPVPAAPSGAEPARGRHAAGRQGQPAAAGGEHRRPRRTQGPAGLGPQRAGRPAARPQTHRRLNHAHRDRLRRQPGPHRTRGPRPRPGTAPHERRP